jgi:hypothetical protein
MQQQQQQQQQEQQQVLSQQQQQTLTWQLHMLCWWRRLQQQGCLQRLLTPRTPSATQSAACVAVMKTAGSAADLKQIAL